MNVVTKCLFIHSNAGKRKFIVSKLHFEVVNFTESQDRIWNGIARNIVPFQIPKKNRTLNMP